jgi:hypothetical protein
MNMHFSLKNLSLLLEALHTNDTAGRQQKVMCPTPNVQHFHMNCLAQVQVTSFHRSVPSSGLFLQGCKVQPSGRSEHILYQSQSLLNAWDCHGEVQRVLLVILVNCGGDLSVNPTSQSSWGPSLHWTVEIHCNM